MMKAASFMYIHPPGYNAESVKAAEMAEETKDDQGESDMVVDASSSKQPGSLPVSDEKKKRRPKDVFGRSLPTGEQFEVLKNVKKENESLTFVILPTPTFVDGLFNHLSLKYMEDGVNLLTIIKATGIYRRPRRRDYVKDYLPPSKSEFKQTVDGNKIYRNLVGPILFSTMADGTIVRGLKGVPDEGTVLLVGYHMQMGVELTSLVEKFLQEKKIVQRDNLKHSREETFVDLKNVYMICC